MLLLDSSGNGKGPHALGTCLDSMSVLDRSDQLTAGYSLRLNTIDLISY